MADLNRPALRSVAGHRVRQEQTRLLLGVVIVAATAVAGSLAVFHCSSSSPPPVEQPLRNNLAGLDACTVQVKNLSLRLWIARTEIQRELGLMWVRPDEMTDNQGMLFVFPDDQGGGFWMKNTLIPLDIAFIRHDGTVAGIDQMEPKSLVTHAPHQPYRYAIEVKAGTLARAGLQVGDIVTIPADLLNR